MRSLLRELPLPKCVEVWGLKPLGELAATTEIEDKRNTGPSNISHGGQQYNIPLVAPKYLKWLRTRNKMCREMLTMVRVGEHPNIVVLHEVLELIEVTLCLADL